MNNNLNEFLCDNIIYIQLVRTVLLFSTLFFYLNLSMIFSITNKKKNRIIKKNIFHRKLFDTPFSLKRFNLDYCLNTKLKPFNMQYSTS